MAATIELLPPAPSIPVKHTENETHSCPECGTSIDMGELEEARRKMMELEAQMELLKEKATAAVDKCADYEDQIRSLKATQNHPGLPRSHTFHTLDPSGPSHDDGRPSTANSTKQSRFSFLTGRRPSPNNSTTPPPPPSRDTTPAPIDTTLINELERERALRTKAEERAQKVDAEIEELSVQLFSQANEMVAEERRARAKLEERVEFLESRDKDKMARLERLEKAVSRIDRVKAILKQPEKAGLGVSVGSATLAPPSRR